MPNPDSYGWGPGWPHCQTDKLVTVQLTSGIRLPVRRELATLIAWLCHETEARGYKLVPGWCWTFACRAVRGYNVASFHSWAMAVDINAPKNPMMHGEPGWAWLHAAGRTDQPQWMPDLWKAHMFEYGGDYPHRQDAMHYGFRGTPADAARITANLHGTPTNPSPLSLRRTLHLGDHGDDVASVQRLLNWNYGLHPFLDCKAYATAQPDGNYGSLTAGAMLHFKEHVHDFEVNFLGPQHKLRHLTFRAPLDNTCGALALGALQAWANTR